MEMERRIHILLLSCLLAVAAHLLSRSFGAPGRPDDANHHHYYGKDVLHAVSGAIGSALSITLLYPLETVRTRLQVTDAPSSSSSSSSINNAVAAAAAPRSTFRLVYDVGKREGLRRGLYKGWFSLVVALTALNFVYFYWFHALRRWGADMAAGRLEYFGGGEVAIDLVVGYLAGVIAVLVTGPLWLVNTRLKLQGVDIGRSGDEGPKEKNANRQYTGIIHCLCKISKEEGALSLWRGTAASVALATNPAINLGVYRMLKRHRLVIDLAGDGGGGGSLEPFVNALLSKFVATVITYPVQVLQTRHRAGIPQDGGTARSARSKSWLGFLLGMYRGLESKLLQTCLNSGIMFVIYERLFDVLATLTMFKDEVN